MEFNPTPRDYPTWKIMEDEISQATPPAHTPFVGCLSHIMERDPHHERKCQDYVWSNAGKYGLEAKRIQGINGSSRDETGEWNRTTRLYQTFPVQEIWERTLFYSDWHSMGSFHCWYLGDGFKYVLFSPLLGEDFQLKGWNHQPDIHFLRVSGWMSWSPHWNWWLYTGQTHKLRWWIRKVVNRCIIAYMEHRILTYIYIYTAICIM